MEGPVGPLGPTGDVGRTGQQGVQGAVGPRGATGPQGLIGPTGRQGLMGVPRPSVPVRIQILTSSVQADVDGTSSSKAIFTDGYPALSGTNPYTSSAISGLSVSSAGNNITIPAGIYLIEAATSYDIAGVTQSIQSASISFVDSSSNILLRSNNIKNAGEELTYGLTCFMSGYVNLNSSTLCSVLYNVTVSPQPPSSFPVPLQRSGCPTIFVTIIKVQ